MYYYHRIIRNCFAVLLVTLLISGCVAPAINPNTEDDLAKIKTIAIVPAEIHIGLKKFAGDDERFTEKEDTTRPQAREICENTLTENGYELVEYDFEAASADDEEFAFLISRFKEDINTANRSQGWAPVGESARELAAIVGADALLFLNYQGIRKSAGEVASNIGQSVLIGVLTLGNYVPVSSTTYGLASMFLVDGVSSDILWKYGAHGAEHVYLVKEALTRFPKTEHSNISQETPATTAIIEN